jgi:hypothetical protein
MPFVRYHGVTRYIAAFRGKAKHEKAIPEAQHEYWKLVKLHKADRSDAPRSEW